MARWSQEGIPHKGWRYVDVEDVCEGLAGDNERVYEQCQMCRNERIRYVHTPCLHCDTSDTARPPEQ